MKNQKKIDLINVEGTIFSISKDEDNMFSIFNTNKKLVIRVSKEALELFFKGQILIVDTDEKEWNFEKTHDAFKNTTEKINNFLNN